MNEFRITMSLLLFVIFCTILYEWTLWRECRTAGSFMYCARVLGK